MFETTAAGHRFRADCRFALHIDILKADDRGTVLEAVAHKYRLGFRDLDQAVAAQAEFFRVAALVHTPPGRTPFALYGVTFVTDDRDALVHCVETVR